MTAAPLPSSPAPAPAVPKAPPLHPHTPAKKVLQLPPSRFSNLSVSSPTMGTEPASSPAPSVLSSSCSSSAPSPFAPPSPSTFSEDVDMGVDEEERLLTRYQQPEQPSLPRVLFPRPPQEKPLQQQQQQQPEQQQQQPEQQQQSTAAASHSSPSGKRASPSSSSSSSPMDPAAKFAAIASRISQKPTRRQAINLEAREKARLKKMQQLTESVDREEQEKMERLRQVSYAKKQGVKKHNEWQANYDFVLKQLNLVSSIIEELPRREVADGEEIGGDLPGTCTRKGVDRNRRAYMNGCHRVEMMIESLTASLVKARTDFRKLAEQGRRLLRSEQDRFVKLVNGNDSEEEDPDEYDEDEEPTEDDENFIAPEGDAE